MAVREILKIGSPSLRERSVELTKSQIRSPMMKRLVRDMTETLASAKGIGLAAPQIGEQYRVVLLDVPEINRYETEGVELPRTVCVNPEITLLEGETAGHWEGCLSVPGKRGYVERPQHIRLTFLDLSGKARAMEFNGFLSTVCQHEIDHLDGVLYVDHVKDPSLFRSDEEFERMAQEG